MKRIQLVGALEYDDEAMHGDDAEAREWFIDHILGGDDLILNDSGDIGDALGTFTLTPNATVVEWHRYGDKLPDMHAWVLVSQQGGGRARRTQYVDYEGDPSWDNAPAYTDDLWCYLPTPPEGGEA